MGAYYGGYYGRGYGHGYGYGYGLGHRGYYGGYYGRGYGGYGYAHHYGKRSADAEAGHALYAGAYGYPYAFGGYPYGYGLGGYRAFYAPVASSHQHVSTPAATYGISQLHKRSADAEPAADAYYGYYGRGYGYGHGYGYGRYAGYG